MDPVPSDATEADVETQFLLPLLTRHDLLNLPLAEIRSKAGISARDIGKGKKRKAGYIPDFCVFKNSLPVLVVEAKSPSHDVATAYSESRLYALEINRSFPPKINPCCRVIATNGITILCGHWDADPSVSLEVSEVVPGTSSFDELDELDELVGNNQLVNIADQMSKSLRSKGFQASFNRGGGPTQISSRIDPNTFAADLAPTLRRYFSSHDQATDTEVYSRAYISSNEVTSYDRILESFLKERLSRAKRRTEITTTKRKSPVITDKISNFNENRPASGDIQLVTGGVGVGKSLFARRYKEYLQPNSLKKKTTGPF